MSARNVPTGLYRNSLGAELHVTQTAMGVYGVRTLAGDIAWAEARDDLLGATTYLVTEASLRDCGYELISHEQEHP